MKYQKVQRYIVKNTLGYRIWGILRSFLQRERASPKTNDGIHMDLAPKWTEIRGEENFV